MPDSDHGIACEGDHRRACAQSIETVGEIHRVRPRRHQEVHPNHEQNGRHKSSCEVEVQERLLDEAHARLSHGETGTCRHDQGENREDRGEHHLAEELAANGQALILLLAHFGEIIDESEQAHRHHGEQSETSSPCGGHSFGQIPVERRSTPAQHDRQHDHDAAECRRASFDLMRFRPVLPDVLPVVELVHNTDQQRRANQRDDQRRQNSYDEGNH